MIFDPEGGVLDYAKRRTTDLKQNSRVIFPKKTTLEVESKLCMLREGSMGVIKNFINEKCGKGGKQKSNLTSAEARGLKSLMTRVEEGEIVVLPTDKTGKFSVMRREDYEMAGLSHSQGDREVKWEEIKTAQREINGHVAMLIKIFNIGKNWDHVERVRETMMGNSMGVCPIQLLFKDHKNGSHKMGRSPLPDK